MVVRINTGEGGLDIGHWTLDIFGITNRYILYIYNI